MTEYPRLTQRMVLELFNGPMTVKWSMGYMSFSKSLDWTIKRFSEDRMTSDARELHECVAKDIATQIGPFDQSLLKYCHTAGSPLKLYHRVDGVFLFKEKIVTIDITTNIRKTVGVNHDYSIPHVVMFIRNGEIRYAIEEIWMIAMLLAGN